MDLDNVAYLLPPMLVVLVHVTTNQQPQHSSYYPCHFIIQYFYRILTIKKMSKLINTHTSKKKTS